MITSTSSRNLDEKSDITPFVGPVSIVTDGYKVYIQSWSKIQRFVGLTNYKFNPIMLKCDPILKQKDALDSASSCLTPKTKSCAPSMILHQTASLSIAMSSIRKCIFEYKGAYSPDLLILDSEGKTIGDMIDICSKPSYKLDQFNSKGIKAIAISKYSLLIPNDDLSDLFYYSKRNDKLDVTFIYNEVYRISEITRQKMLYSLNTLMFFAYGKDSLGRSIESHSKAAKDVLERIMIDDMKDIIIEKDKVDQKKVFSEYRSKMIKIIDLALKKEKRIKENHYFITPRHLLRDIYTEKEDIQDFVLIDGIMKRRPIEHKDEVILERKLYELIDNVPVHPNMYIDAGTFALKKTTYMERTVDEINALLKELVGNGLDGKHKELDPLVMRLRLTKYVTSKLYTSINDSKDIIVKARKFKAQHKIYPLGVLDAPQLDAKSWLSLKYEIDPDHRKMIELHSADKIIPILEQSRDYHELRFRARISTAIMLNHKPDNPMKVKHFMFSTVEAHVIVKGMILDSDKGIAIVSYLYQGELWRTEKWRLADVENYSVNHHRLVSLMCCLEKKMLITPQLMLACKIYSRILSENSWGLSTVLKPFRYLSTGLLVKSPMIESQFKKVEEALIKHPWKLSLLYIFESMRYRDGKTPLFGLDWKDLGWEIFLVNLCPSKTYGKLRHMDNISLELFSELELHDSNFDVIKVVYDDFEKILESKEDLHSLYYDHFSKIMKLSKSTDDRFTFSPASIVMIYNDFPKEKGYMRFQDMMPHITDLMTAKSSFDTYQGKKCLALESISTLTKQYKCESTTLLALKILNKNGIPDMLMWLFDKNQTGGDREISVLTGEFRILQVVAERFMEAISKLTDNEFLKRDDKIERLFERSEKCLDSKGAMFATLDQTRWGPNFNTLIFGLIAMSYCRHTTEAYIPALILLISEFKGFEVPCYLPKHKKNINFYYSLPSRISRSHMGQGIFHMSSSVYHSLVTKTLLSIPHKIVSDEIPKEYRKRIQVYTTSFITSDDSTQLSAIDCQASLYHYEFKDSSEEITEVENRMTLFFKNKMFCFFKALHKFLIYFGIKTSKYKNWISEKAFEFNSFFISSDGIGSNEIKFIYSLIDPSTTGNFLQDYANVLNTYYDAANSGVSPSLMPIIVHGNYLRFCRQWKIRPDLVGFPSEKTYKNGLTPILREKVDDNLSFYDTKTPSTLRFKLRNILSRFDAPTSITEAALQLRYSEISRSRAKTSYRSCITHSKVSKIVNMSKYFDTMDAIGESYELFVLKCNENPNHYEDILNDHEHVYLKTREEKVSRRSRFQMMKIKDTKSYGESMWQILLAYYAPVNYINSESSSDEIILHEMRDLRHTEMADDIFKISHLNLIDKMMAIKDLENPTEISSSKSFVIKFSESREATKYVRTTWHPPIEETLYKTSVNFVAHKFDYRENYGCMRDTILDVKFSLGNIVVNLAEGPKSCLYKDIYNVIISDPILDELTGYADGIIEAEESLRSLYKIEETWLNILVPESFTTKVFTEEFGRTDLPVSPTNFDDLDIFGDTSDMIDVISKFLDPVLSVIERKEELAKERDTTDFEEESLVDSEVAQIYDTLTTSYATSKYVSIKLKSIHSEYMGGSRSLILRTWLLDQLVNKQVLKCFDHDKRFIFHNTYKYLASDVNIARKFDETVRRVLSKINYSTYPINLNWINLCKSMIRDEPVFDVKCMMVQHPKISISASRLGKEILEEDMLRALDIIS